MAKKLIQGKQYKKGRSIRIRIETGNIYGSGDELIYIKKEDPLE